MSKFNPSKIIANFIEKYDQLSKENLELEIRVRSSSDAFLGLYRHFKEECKTEYSINVLTDIASNKKNMGTRIRQQLFIFNEKTKDFTKTDENYVLKTRLERSMPIVGCINYIIVISREEPFGQHNTTSSSKCRIKYRKSTQIENWRLDMTKVREITSQTEVRRLKELRDELFLRDFEKIINDKLEIELEYIGEISPTITDFTIVDKIMNVIEPNYISNAIYLAELDNIASITLDRNIRNKTLKNITVQTIGLTKNTYAKIYPPTGYYLTDKVDGTHAVISINGTKCRITTDKVKEIEGKESFALMVDAEVLNNGRVFVFDVMMFKGANLTSKPFKERITFIPNCVLAINKFGIVANKKVYRVLSERNLKDEITLIDKMKRDYETDGLIFNSPNESYMKTKIYKWKPYDKNTIDFLVRKCPKELLGISPYISKEGYHLYLLFVTINYSMFNKLGLKYVEGYKKLFPNMSQSDVFPIQFAPSDNPRAYIWYSKEELDEKICELSRNTDNTDWILLRERDDRMVAYRSGTYFGNFFHTAEDNWQNFSNRFELIDLYSSPDNYFLTEKDTFYNAPIGFNSFVKSSLIKQIANSNLVVDLACGRGADLNRYYIYGIKKLVMVDSDSNALTELIARKYNILRHKRDLDNFISILTVQSDITQYKETKDKIYNILNTDSPNVNHIVCNFAIHYFVKNIAGFVSLVNDLLLSKGTIIITYQDGKKTFDLLKKNEGEIALYEGTRIKYHIKAKYSSKTFTNGSQKIDILLPFSQGKMYEEELVKIDTIISIFKKANFLLIDHGEFMNSFDKFKTINNQVWSNVSEIDKTFLSLYDYVVFQKK